MKQATSFRGITGCDAPFEVLNTGQHRIAMKKWNERRAQAETNGLEKFRKLAADPILHPSKFKKS